MFSHGRGTPVEHPGKRARQHCRRSCEQRFEALPENPKEGTSEHLFLRAVSQYFSISEKNRRTSIEGKRTHLGTYRMLMPRVLGGP